MFGEAKVKGRVGLAVKNTLETAELRYSPIDNNQIRFGPGGVFEASDYGFVKAIKVRYSMGIFDLISSILSFV